MRGQGIGKKLIQRLIEYCKEKNYQKIFLWTVDELLIARKIYEEFGFTLPSKARKLSYGEKYDRRTMGFVFETEPLKG